MSLSVVLKPSGIQAVGTGSLNYTFSEGAISGKPNYRVEIELSGLSSVPKFQFRADSTGAVTADIAGMLRLALSMSFSTSARFIVTHVKYQGIWDGGSYSQVDLTSDIIYAYIGSINQTNSRTRNYLDGGTILNTNFTGTIDPWYNDTASGGTLSWTYNSGTARVSWGGGGGNSYPLRQDVLFPKDTYTFYLSLTPTVISGGSANVVVWLEDDAGNKLYLIIDGGGPQLNPTSVTFKSYATGSTYNEVIVATTTFNYNRIMIKASDGGFAGNVAIDYFYSDPMPYATERPILVPCSKVPAWNNRLAFADYINNGAFTDQYIAILALPKSGSSYPTIMAGSHAISGSALHSDPWLQYDNRSIKIVTSPDSTKVVNFNVSSFANQHKIYYGSPDIGQGFAQTFRTPTGVSGNAPKFRIVVNKVGDPTFTITFKVLGTSAGLPNTSDVKGTMIVDLTPCYNPLDESFSTVIFLDDFGFNVADSTDYALQIVPNNDGVGDSANYYLFYSSSTSQMANGSICTKSGGVWTADTSKDLAGSYWAFINTWVEYDIETMSGCENPIQLKWLNDYGGISTWVFDYNQVLENAPQDSFRLRNVLLNADGLTREQWEMLQQLNRNGIDYGDNLKSGALVQDITDPANPINIFVLPEPRQTQSRLLGHKFECTIRYPRIGNIGI